MRDLRSFVLLFSVVIFAAFFLFRSSGAEAVHSAGTGEVPQFENYDIRLDDSTDARAVLEMLRQREGVPAAVVFAGRDRTASAVAAFKSSGSRVIESGIMGVPEVISPALGGGFLTKPSKRSRFSILTDYLRRNSDLIGIDAASVEELSVAADYQNPDGNLSFVVLRQTIEGVPVFSGEIKAGFTRRNEIIRMINGLAPGARPNNFSPRFGAPEQAIANASRFVPQQAEVQARDTTAERMLFPIDHGVLRPAWRVLLYLPNDAFYVVVDAEDGTLLWRKNIVETQTLNATFGVYGTNAGLMMTADSPTPATPFTCAAPAGCAQPPVIGRTLFTLVGNEAPNTFNNLGWIPDTGLPVRTPANPNITDGNNAEVGIDRDGINGVDPLGHAVGNPTRVFNFAYNPAPGNPPPPDNPTPPTPQTYPPTPFQQGVVTHGFYTVNRWHDATYRLGFTEPAGNFQHFNFGRGGSEDDRVSFDVQDSSGTNGANFSTPADGGRGRMQMFLWTGATPDRDGTLDSQIVVHELTHGITGRLHGNATGLNNNMARGMGEGWSDFFAIALLSEPADARLGVYAVGGYVTYQILAGYDANYYYGLRRFPNAIKASTGQNGRPHNPLTFGYLNSNCNVLIGTTTDGPNSAFPRGPIGVNTCDQIHNLGEIWSAALWEVRNQLVTRHGASEGNRRVLQYVMDGMKISPITPHMIQARDSILFAAQASDPGDTHLVWRGFAIRGMGWNAAVISPGSGANNTVVTESFDMPPQYRRPARADYDGDGRTDVSVYRPSDRNWYLDRSTAGFAAVNWGLSADVPVPADYDGDNKADVAVYRGGSESLFYILRSSDATVSIVSWGVAGDVPAIEEYDGDGKYDITIFRPSTQSFWVLRSSNGTSQVSVSHRTDPASRPITGDFDGDGKADFGTVRDGHWIIYTSMNNYAQTYFLQLSNNDSDYLVPADYDGDGIDDLAFYRPSNGTWTIRLSSGGTRSTAWGISTDRAAPADYDGDGRADVAVYRDGTWWINGSTAGTRVTQFGLAGDIPTPAANTQ